MGHGGDAGYYGGDAGYLGLEAMEDSEDLKALIT